MSQPHIQPQSACDKDREGHRLKFGPGGLQASTLAYFAAKVRALSDFRVSAVQLEWNERSRGMSDADRRGAELSLTRHLQTSHVYQILGFVDALRPRCALLGMQFHDSGRHIRAAVRHDGWLTVTPAASGSSVYWQLTEALDAPMECLGTSTRRRR